MTQKRVLCIKMFSKLSEQIDDLNFTTVQYSLHWSSKSMRHKKSDSQFAAIHRVTDIYFFFNLPDIVAQHGVIHASKRSVLYQE